jgi:signal transduction histidine kinase
VAQFRETTRCNSLVEGRQTAKEPEFAESTDSQQRAGTAKPVLRPILLLGFGALLVLLVSSGFSALHILTKLHAAEVSGRVRPLDRKRTLAAVVISADIYSDQIEAFLLAFENSRTAVDDQILTSSAAVRAALQSFPLDQSPEEQYLIQQMRKSLAEQDAIFLSARRWNPADRRRFAPGILSANMIPSRHQLVAAVQRMDSLSNVELAAAEQNSLARFAVLHGRLLRLLLVTLSSSLAIAIGCGLYILRLERQGLFRYAELSRSQHQLRQLSARLLDAQEEERKSISRDLHDEVGQALSLLLIDIGLLSHRVTRIDEKAQDLIARIREVTEKTLETVRDMALLLRPSMLDDLGLVEAVQWCAREMSRRQGLEIEVHAQDIPKDVSDELKLCIYRVVQEALANAQRHARSKHALVSLLHDDSNIEVKVEDYGAGFDAQRTRGMGLLGMEERVTRLGGQLTIESHAGSGTTIRARFPLASIPSPVS